jgi:hypothetical protein
LASPIDTGGRRCGEVVLVRDSDGDQVMFECEAEHQHGGPHLITGRAADANGNMVFNFQLTYDQPPS